MKGGSARSAPPIRTPKRPTPPADIPLVIAAPTASDHLEVMTRAIFQAGLSWAMIAARWDAFRTAFANFDIRRVATYDANDLERLLATERIVHSAKKLEGTFANARALIDVEREFGSIAVYLGRFAHYDEAFADARARFAFMGDLNYYYWRFRTANPVPLFDDWMARQPKDHPRMREMVLLARATGSSSERANF